MNFEIIAGLATTGACALGWFLSARQSRARESLRRDLTAAFAARNDAATLELAKRLSADEERLWRRLVTKRSALQETKNEEVRARRDLEDVLAALQDAVLVVDSEARLRFLNAAALRLFDVQIQDVLGAHLIEALPSFGIDAAMRAALREGQSSSTEIHLYAPKLREVFLRVSPVFSGAGSEVGAVAILQDLTELRRLERVRRDFVANASHELRTPIANIRATAETLLHAPDDPQLVGRFLPPLINEAERLSRLVSDLLDLARAENAEPAPIGPVALENVVQSAIERLREKARRHEITVEWKPGGVRPTVSGDGAGLEQVAFNLLDNALSYTPKGGTVRLKLSAKNGSGSDEIAFVDEHQTSISDKSGFVDEAQTPQIVAPGGFHSDAPHSAVLEVSDSGIGIPHNDLPRVFERFYRVDKARSRAEGGTGLGLAIVKHIVENHGGRVEVESKVGEGTTFRVELPVSENA